MSPEVRMWICKHAKSLNYGLMAVVVVSVCVYSLLVQAGVSLNWWIGVLITALFVAWTISAIIYYVYLFSAR